MVRIHPPRFQSVSEYHDIGSFQVIERSINPHSEAAAVDHCAKWKLFIRVLILVLGIAVLCGFIAFIGIAWDAYYEKGEANPRDAEELNRLLSGLSLLPPTKVVAT